MKDLEKDDYSLNVLYVHCNACGVGKSIVNGDIDRARAFRDTHQVMCWNQGDAK